MGGLKCFQRNGKQAIPGCKGLGVNTWDYCYDPKDAPPKPSVVCKTKGVMSGANQNNPKNLGKCCGECDSDKHCAKGLKCFQRNNGEPIPGCNGKGSGKDWDYCYDPKHNVLGGPNIANAKNLAKCWGECDRDSHCKKDLKCFQRNGRQPIPGCKGLGVSTWDYCYDPKDAPPKPSVVCKKKGVMSGANQSNPKNLGKCCGECDSDKHCAKGLKCFQRNNGEPIPGCTGKGSGKGWDYCYDPKHNVLGGPNLSNPKNLAKCWGECDRDSHCKKGLKCFQRNGRQPIPGCKGLGVSTWDYCYDPKDAPPKPSVVCKKKGVMSGANQSNPKNLGKCCGECDSDKHCAKGLKCFQRKKGEPIPGCTGKGSGKDWDYCYDPKHNV